LREHHAGCRLLQALLPPVGVPALLCALCRPAAALLLAIRCSTLFASKIRPNPRCLVTQLPLRCCIIQSSALVQALSSSSMGRARTWPTEATHHRNAFSPNSRGFFSMILCFPDLAFYRIRHFPGFGIIQYFTASRIWHSPGFGSFKKKTQYGMCSYRWYSYQEKYDTCVDKCQEESVERKDRENERAMLVARGMGQARHPMKTEIIMWPKH